MTTLATLVVRLVGDTSELEKSVRQTDEAVGGLRRGIGGLGNVLKGAGLALGGAALVKVGLDAVGAASDLDESLNKVNVVFGENAAAIASWSASASTNLGQTQQQALEAVGTFGNLFSSMEIGPDAAAEMSTSLVALASDLASFNNIEPDVALEKLRAGLLGEAEPLRTLGVNLSAASTEAYALSNGLAATKEELTPAILAQARYALILEQTTLAQGDFARTSDGLANTQRTLRAQISDLTASLGTALLPIAQQVLGWVSRLVGWFQNLDPKVQRIIVVVAGLAAGATALAPILGTVATVIGALASPIGIVIAAIAALAAAWATDFGGIRTTVTQFWNDNLKPIFDTLVAWLQENIPVALAALARYWDTVLKPAIETVWSFLKQYIFPVVETLVNVYIALMKKELQALGWVWTNVLKPAIEAVWSFLQQYVIPLLSSLANVYIAALKLGLRNLARLWEFVLKPAMEKVWEFLEKHVIPIFVDLKSKLDGPVGTALRTARDLFDTIGGAISTIGDAVSDVIGWLDDLANKLNSFSVPSWIKDLAGQLGSINIQLPKINLPGGNDGGGTRSAAAAGSTRGAVAAGGAAGWNVTINVQGGMTNAETGRAVEMGVLRAARSLGYR